MERISGLPRPKPRRAYLPPPRTQSTRGELSLDDDSLGILRLIHGRNKGFESHKLQDYALMVLVRSLSWIGSKHGLTLEPRFAEPIASNHGLLRHLLRQKVKVPVPEERKGKTKSEHEEATTAISGLHYFLSHCVQGSEIHVLDISNLEAPSGLLRTIAPLVPSLTHLNASGANEDINPREWAAVTQHCSKLTTLVLGKQGSDDAIETIGGRLPNLTAVDLSHSPITDKGLQALGRHHSNIRVFSLDGCLKHSTDGVSQLLSRCTSLQSLSLSGPTFHRERRLERIVRHAFQLVELNIDGCLFSDEELAQLTERMTRLSCLKMSVFVRIAEKNMLAFLQRRGPQLTELRLSDCRLPISQRSPLCLFSTKLLQALTSRGVNLTALTLEKVRLSDVFLQQLATNCCDLRELGFRGSEGFTARGLSYLSQLNSLTHLDLRHCTAATIQAVGALTQLTSMQVIDLAYAPRVRAALSQPPKGWSKNGVGQLTRDEDG